MTAMTDTLVERLPYIAAILEANKDKFAVPDHIEAKAASIREAAAHLKAQASRIAELKRSNDAKDEALAYAESILTAVSSAGVGEAMDRIRKARSHSSETGND